ncbi:hypothetical protein [Amycolatopsis alba]|nr:hypothetical protein [Amycolatopsis alba]
MVILPSALISADGDVVSHSGDLFESGSEEGDLAAVLRRVLAGLSGL